MCLRRSNVKLNHLTAPLHSYVSTHSFSKDVASKPLSYSSMDAFSQKVKSCRSLMLNLGTLRQLTLLARSIVHSPSKKEFCTGATRFSREERPSSAILAALSQQFSTASIQINVRQYVWHKSLRKVRSLTDHITSLTTQSAKPARALLPVCPPVP